MFKVLVVDDDRDAAEFLKRLLEKKFSCTVFLAFNGLEGLEKAKEIVPEIVFLDITMPGMNGIEVLKSFKNDKELNPIPTIMLTAISEKKVFITAMKIGAVDYILKPLVYLPAYERIKEIFSNIKYNEAKKKRIQRLEEPHIKSKTLMLLVEEDKSFVKHFVGKMDDGYEVEVVDFGTAAIKSYKDKMHRVVCIGESLPDMNPLFLAKQIKKMAGLRDVKIYALKEIQSLTSEESEFFDLVISKKITDRL